MSTKQIPFQVEPQNLFSSKQDDEILKKKTLFFGFSFPRSNQVYKIEPSHFKKNMGKSKQIRKKSVETSDYIYTNEISKKMSTPQKNGVSNHHFKSIVTFCSVLRTHRKPLKASKETLANSGTSQNMKKTEKP